MQLQLYKSLEISHIEQEITDSQVVNSISGWRSCMFHFVLYFCCGCEQYRVSTYVVSERSRASNMVGSEVTHASGQNNMTTAEISLVP